MESQRLILFFVFSFSLFMLYDAWQRDQQPVRPPATVTAKDAKETKDATLPTPSEKLVPPPIATPAAQRARLQPGRSSRRRPTSFTPRSVLPAAICAGSS